MKIALFLIISALQFYRGDYIFATAALILAILLLTWEFGGERFVKKQIQRFKKTKP